MAEDGYVQDVSFAVGVDISGFETGLNVAEASVQSLIGCIEDAKRAFQEISDAFEQSVASSGAFVEPLERIRAEVQVCVESLSAFTGSLQEMGGGTKAVGRDLAVLVQSVQNISQAESVLTANNAKTKAAFSVLSDAVNTVIEPVNALAASEKILSDILSSGADDQALLSKRYDEYGKLLQSGKISQEEYDESLRVAATSFANAQSGVSVYSKSILGLVDLLSQGTISQTAYEQQLANAKQGFEVIVAPIEQYGEALRKASEEAAKLGETVAEAETQGQSKAVPADAPEEGQSKTASVDAPKKGQSKTAPADEFDAPDEAFKKARSAVDVYKQAVAALDEALREGQISQAVYERGLLDAKSSLGVVVSEADKYRVSLLQLEESLDKSVISQREFDDAAEAARASYAGSYSAAADYGKAIKDLQEKYDAGAISQSEYQSRLSTLKDGFGLVTYSADAYSTEMLKLEEALKAGAISQQEFDAAVESASKSIDEMTVALSACISVPLLGFLVGNVYAAADFEQAIKKVQHTLGDLTSQANKVGDVSGLQALTAAAGKFAAEFGVEMGDVVESVEHLGKVGFNTAQALAVLETVMKASVAGGVVMTEAADELAGAYRALGLSMEETTERIAANFQYLANQYAIAATQTSSGVKDFAEAMSSGAGEATRVFVSATNDMQQAVNTTMAVLSVFAKTGFAEGQKAGEMFGVVVDNITKSINEHREAWTTLVGFNPIDDLTGQYKDLGSILDTLSQRFGHLEGEMLKVALSQLGFSTAAIRAIEPLLKNNQMLAEFREALGAGEDSLDSLADTLGGGLYTELNKLKGALQAVAVSLGNDLLPYVTAVMGEVRRFISVFSEMPQTLRLAVSGFALFVGGSAAAVGGLAAMRISAGMVSKELGMIRIIALRSLSPLLLMVKLPFMPLVSGVSALTAAFKAVAIGARVGWLSVLGPVGLVIAGIAGVTAGVVAAAKIFQMFANNDLTSSRLFAGLKKIIDVVRAVASNFQGSMKIIQEYLDEVTNGGLSAFIKGVVDGASAAGDALLVIGKNILMFYAKVADGIVYAFDVAWSLITGGAPAEFGKVSTMLEAIIGGANELANRLLDGAASAKAQRDELDKTKATLEDIKKSVNEEITLQTEAARTIQEKAEAYLKQQRTLGMTSEMAEIWEMEYKLIGDAESRLVGYKQRLADLQKAKEQYAGKNTADMTDEERKAYDNLNASIDLTERQLNALTDQTARNRAEIDKLRTSWLMLQAAQTGQAMKEQIRDIQLSVYSLVKGERAATDLDMRMKGVAESTRKARLMAMDLQKSMEGEKSARDEVRSLRERVNSMALGADMAQRFALSMSGASDATIQQVKLLQALNNQMSAMEQYTQEADNLMNSMSDEKKLSNYGNLIKKYEGMLEAGLIDAQAYARATADAYGKIQEELHVRVTLEGLDDFNATSVKFIKRMQEMAVGGNMKIKPPKAAADVMQSERQATAKAVAEIQALQKKAAALRKQAENAVGESKEVYAGRAVKVEAELAQRQAALAEREKMKSQYQRNVAAGRSREARDARGVLVGADQRQADEEAAARRAMPGAEQQVQYQQAVQNYASVRNQSAVITGNIQTLKDEYKKKLNVAGTPSAELDELRAKIAEQEQLYAQQKEAEKSAKAKVDETVNAWAATGNPMATALQAAPLREDEFISKFEDAAMQPMIAAFDAHADGMVALVKAQQDLEAATRELANTMLNAPEYAQYKQAEADVAKTQKDYDANAAALADADKRSTDVEARYKKAVEKNNPETMRKQLLDARVASVVTGVDAGDVKHSHKEAAKAWKLIEKATGKAGWKGQAIDKELYNAAMVMQQKRSQGDELWKDVSDEEMVSRITHYKKDSDRVRKGQKEGKSYDFNMKDHETAANEIKQLETEAEKLGAEWEELRKKQEVLGVAKLEAQAKFDDAKSNVSPELIAQMDAQKGRVDELNRHKSTLAAAVPHVFNGVSPDVVAGGASGIEGVLPPSDFAALRGLDLRRKKGSDPYAGMPPELRAMGAVTEQELQAIQQAGSQDDQSRGAARAVLDKIEGELKASIKNNMLDDNAYNRIALLPEPSLPKTFPSGSTLPPSVSSDIYGQSSTNNRMIQQAKDQYNALQSGVIPDMLRFVEPQNMPFLQQEQFPVPVPALQEKSLTADPFFVPNGQEPDNKISIAMLEQLILIAKNTANSFEIETVSL
ncbi:MAG: phage tail tape measure protein [Planctomycetaceae bacterium]|jgi:TP901 family phage tail tape measure protein|nr:phage tail tape measure protein [Planctomycetaceae bacterium]